MDRLAESPFPKSMVSMVFNACLCQSMIGRALGGPGCNRQILNLAALPIDFGSRGSQGSTGHV